MAANITESLNFLATTVGRDKTYRAVQYFARFYAWYLLRKGYPKTEVARWNALKETLGMSRKLMRIGKPLEHINSANNALGDRDQVLRTTKICKQLGYAGYLSLDMLVWIHKTGFYKFADIKTINERAQKFWLAGIVVSIVSSIYKLTQIQSRLGDAESNSRVKQALGVAGSKNPAEAGHPANEKKLDKERYEAAYQLIQDILDATIPGTALGYIDLDDGIVGLAGVVTSFMGASTQWKKVNAKR